ncbi:hypothetical protein V9T40_011112 [Parthenolecanium corni]|uniref:CHCH domain-containing protein n=1 Tax=Parthenolecanium corni TaxID=536013 RepID=A0AAN9T6E6_9HEMI
MSYCRKEGKDIIIFATKEEHQIPSTVTIPEPEKQPGIILSDGSINWNCPCLGGMATGPCGIEFREAFSCFHYSKADPKGSDCLKAFSQMQECMKTYPAVYASKTDDVEDSFDIEDEQDEASASIAKELENDTLNKEIEKQ